MHNIRSCQFRSCTSRSANSAPSTVAAAQLTSAAHAVRDVPSEKNRNTSHRVGSRVRPNANPMLVYNVFLCTMLLFFGVGVVVMKKILF